MTGRSDDPLGARSLFSGAPAGDGSGEPAGDGRRALFSGPSIGPRSVVVDCHGCGARRPLGVLPLAVRLVPSLWWPPGRYSRYMRCPECGRWEWCRLDWGSFRPW